MKKIISTLIWSLCFIMLLVVSDQFLLRYPGQATPMLNDFQQFYQDFRSRLLKTASSTPTIEQVIERQQQPETHAAAIAEKALSYVYVDQNGELNFTKSLEEIPDRFRQSAQPLKDN